MDGWRGDCREVSGSYCRRRRLGWRSRIFQSLFELQGRVGLCGLGEGKVGKCYGNYVFSENDEIQRLEGGMPLSYLFLRGRHLSYRACPCRSSCTLVCIRLPRCQWLLEATLCSVHRSESKPPNKGISKTSNTTQLFQDIAYGIFRRRIMMSAYPSTPDLALGEEKATCSPNSSQRVVRFWLTKSIER